MLKRIAEWNPARDVWEVETMGLFCEHSDAFLETWPASGMTRGGVAYVLPMWVPRMVGSGCSSSPTPRATRGGSATETVALLPTPMAKNGDGQSLEARQSRGHGAYLEDITHLLPTPGASDVTGGGSDPEARRASGHHVQLIDWAVGALLPTPLVSDGVGGRTMSFGKADATLQGVMTGLLTGARTARPSPGGSPPSDVPHPHPPTPDPEAANDSPPDSWSSSWDYLPGMSPTSPDCPATTN